MAVRFRIRRFCALLLLFAAQVWIAGVLLLTRKTDLLLWGSAAAALLWLLYAVRRATCGSRAEAALAGCALLGSLLLAVVGLAYKLL